MAQMPEAIILRKTEETKTGVTYCIADVKTNADRIRSMTDEELARFLFREEPWCTVDRECVHSCGTCLENWLKEEVRR